MNAVVNAIRASWSAETSNNPMWSPGSPELGQCAVTALVVQDAFGGRLLRATVDGVSHYLNGLPDGTILDLTFGQFPAGSSYDTGFTERSREYLLSNEDTVRRYHLLGSAVAGRLWDAA